MRSRLEFRLNALWFQYGTLAPLGCHVEALASIVMHASQIHHYIISSMMTTKMGERDSTEEITKAFKLFDDDHTGKINLKNLKRVANELGENMTDEELQVTALYTYGNYQVTLPLVGGFLMFMQQRIYAGSG